jgi:hypothetical protein
MVALAERLRLSGKPGSSRIRHAGPTSARLICQRSPLLRLIYGEPNIFPATRLTVLKTSPRNVTIWEFFGVQGTYRHSFWHPHLCVTATAYPPLQCPCHSAELDGRLTQSRGHQVLSHLQCGERRFRLVSSRMRNGRHHLIVCCRLHRLAPPGLIACNSRST